MTVQESPLFDEFFVSPNTDLNADLSVGVTELSISPTESGETSPTLVDAEFPSGDSVLTTQKKKKKKKPKKSAKAKEAAAAKAKALLDSPDDGRPPVLCISRNKHWRYISSYHGPWLQLPLELLESLLVLNLDPTTLTAPESRMTIMPPSSPVIPTSASGKQRDRGFYSLSDHGYSPPESPRYFTSMHLPPPFPLPRPGKATPPPIDPGVFRSVTSIRRLIDEAAELSVRASSGLSAAELNSTRSGGSLGGSAWAAAQSLGINPMGSGGGGRNVPISAMRIQRLRALAVQKLAEAYKTDEIASSVMVMQGGSVFDDVAEKVLKVNPNDADARYVHFFHEKIPSRQLAESTCTRVLDELISMHPHRLEYYRTRGIVHCFRDEYPQAIVDFTYALKESRAARKTRIHRSNSEPDPAMSRTTKKRGNKAKTNGQAPPDGTSSLSGEANFDGSEGEPLLLHPSVLPEAPDPIEPQLLFLRGAAYLQQAIHLIEGVVLRLEGVKKASSIDGAELRLCYLEHGLYGGVEIGNPEGPLGSNVGVKLKAYREVLAEAKFRDSIGSLLKKSLRDHERFLGHFDSLEGRIKDESEVDITAQMDWAFMRTENVRPGSHASPLHRPTQLTYADIPAMFTTYHPLLVESHFSVLICKLMMADFRGLLTGFQRTAATLDGLEGYPVFLPPRSMGQAEFVELLERLAGGWKKGTLPHSLSTLVRRGKERLAIEAPPSVFEEIQSPLDSPDENHQQQMFGGSSSSSSTSRRGSPNGDNGSASFVNHINGYSTPVAPLRPDAADALDCARILLSPVVKRQRERAEKLAAEKAAGGKKKPIPINIPLHGPRVEVVLAWLGAVHLPELDGV
ncbi:hypothetical protein BDQ12DRAFT_625105 [Crucibulum laeve]|uniref:Uncharacterized protein n=1 Tax=Crucibulum laeve TaxID=68775 RepID=A0A5C3MLW5_9AGAR|nr:hypothetical protein BDQ12DRAFT_625105 [Crucibulum laeve]